MTLVVIGCGPARQEFPHDYSAVVQAVDTLYPDPTIPRNHDTRWVFDHPAYGPHTGGFRVNVDRGEIEAGKRYELTIHNGTKFDSRHTTINVTAVRDTKTQVKIDSIGTASGFFRNSSNQRDSSYQNERMREIERYLKAVTSSRE